MRKKLGDTIKKKSNVEAVIDHVHNGETVNHNDSKPVKEQAAKATYYLNPNACDAIDEMQYRIRKMVKSNKSKINKSLIVEQAILLVAKEFLKNPENSEFAKEIIKKT